MPTTAPEAPIQVASDAGSPPDRTLELAGLEALIKEQKAREAEAVAADGVLQPSEINWTTHRKEGMRLKRLMEESPDGKAFPHMMEMWNAGKDAACGCSTCFYFVFSFLRWSIQLLGVMDFPHAVHSDHARTERFSFASGRSTTSTLTRSRLTW